MLISKIGIQRFDIQGPKWIGGRPNQQTTGKQTNKNWKSLQSLSECWTSKTTQLMTLAWILKVRVSCLFHVPFLSLLMAIWTSFDYSEMSWWFWQFRNSSLVRRGEKKRSSAALWLSEYHMFPGKICMEVQIQPRLSFLILKSMFGIHQKNHHWF